MNSPDKVSLVGYFGVNSDVSGVYLLSYNSMPASKDSFQVFTPLKY